MVNCYTLAFAASSLLSSVGPSLVVQAAPVWGSSDFDTLLGRATVANGAANVIPSKRSYDLDQRAPGHKCPGRGGRWKSTLDPGRENLERGIADRTRRALGSASDLDLLERFIANLEERNLELEEGIKERNNLELEGRAGRCTVCGRWRGQVRGTVHVCPGSTNDPKEPGVKRCSVCNQWLGTSGGVHTCPGGGGRGKKGN
ncbi:hypothetical protein CC2G_008310 [Coprinopsis cinerea AmutBmut pab1-1]|nr:hypothetical protein CC2G_008310 [Coprinopsis cinerea AmutBmut pab1-1]